MKAAISVNAVTYEKVIDLFVKRSEKKLILAPSIGKGYVQIFDLEKGLQARFWDCCLNEEMDLYSDAEHEIENAYFTLAFFLNPEVLQFAEKGTFLQKNIIWDTLFISAVSEYKMHIASTSRVHCLSISFSKKWLNNNVFREKEAFETLKEEIDRAESFSLLESMNSSEKETIKELLHASWKKSLGSFYIKSAVLKIVCDFFYKLKEKQSPDTKTFSPVNLISEVEKFLNDHITSSPPKLKDVAIKFSISESTLNRHFRKKHGVNISTYFFRRRMEYGRYLLQEKNKNFTETAYLLGYRNVNHFINMFRKYQEALRDCEDEKR